MKIEHLSIFLPHSGDGASEGESDFAVYEDDTATAARSPDARLAVEAAAPEDNRLPNALSFKTPGFRPQQLRCVRCFTCLLL